MAVAGLYVILPVALTVVAVRNISGDIADIQSQLSTSGLAAASFESTDSVGEELAEKCDRNEERFEELRGEVTKGESKKVGFAIRSRGR